MENQSLEIATTVSIDDSEIYSFKNNVKIQQTSTSNKSEESVGNGVIYAGVFYIALIIVGLVAIRLLDNFLGIWLIACIIGNLLIGAFIYLLHERFGTTRNKDWNERSLKNVGNFFELLLYSFLLSFGAIVLFAGIFIAKNVGDIGKPKNTSNIVAIYRWGLALQLILVLLCAFLLSQSTYQESFIKNNLHFLQDKVEKVELDHL